MPPIAPGPQMPPASSSMPPMPGAMDSSPVGVPSPDMAGMAPGMSPENAPMTEEHKAELKELLTKVKQEYSKWRSMSFGMQNQANEARRDELKKVFQILQAKGVNLNDPKSVAAFLTNLKKTAPQHFDAITKALDYLLGTDYENQQQAADPLSVQPVDGGQPSIGGPIGTDPSGGQPGLADAGASGIPTGPGPGPAQ